MDNKRSFWRLGFKWRRTPFVAPSGKLVGVTQIDGTEKIIPNSELHTELRSLTYTGQRLREALFEKKARNMFAPKKEMTPIPQASLIALRGLSKRLFEEVAALDFVGVQESKRPQRDLGPSGRFHYVYYLACYDPAICDDDDQPVFHRARAPLSAGIEVEAVEEFRVNAAHYCDDDKLTLIRLDITSTRWQKYVDGVWQELAEEPICFEFDSESGVFCSLDKAGCCKGVVAEEPCEKCGGPVTPNGVGRLECSKCGPDLYPYLP